MRTVTKYRNKQFWLHNVWEWTLQLMNTHIANMVHFPTCRKVWLNSVCWPPRAKPDNEVECRIYEGWVKTPVIFLSRLWAQVHEVSRRCKNPLYFPMPLSDCLPCFIQKMFSIKSRNRRNNDQMYTVFWPQFLRRDDSDFSTGDCYHDLLSTVWQSLVEFCLLMSDCEA